MQVILGRQNRQLTGPIYDGMCIRQAFLSAGSSLRSIDMFFATYMRKNEGEIHVEILDFRRRIVARTKVNAENLEDNAFREFGLKCKLVKGHKYELKVWTQNCRAGNSPTAAWGNKTSCNHLFIGRSLIRGGELTCNFNYDDPDEPVRKPSQDSAPQESKSNPISSQSPPLPPDAVRGLVSVVIPHFKCEKFLPKCLSSLAAQSYSCLEVFVVDDGSPEPQKVQEIVNLFKNVIPAIHFIQLEENKGAPVARNAGALLAAGEYLFFCDADVELYKESLEVLVRCLLEVPGADFAYGGFTWGGRRVPPLPFDVERLRQRNYVTTMSLLRRVRFPGWDESLKRHQDWDLWLTMVGKGSTGVCCGKYLFETPVREGSISTENNIPFDESIAIVKKKHGLEVR